MSSHPINTGQEAISLPGSTVAEAMGMGRCLTVQGAAKHGHNLEPRYDCAAEFTRQVRSIGHMPSFENRLRFRAWPFDAETEDPAAMRYCRRNVLTRRAVI